MDTSYLENMISDTYVSGKRFVTTEESPESKRTGTANWWDCSSMTNAELVELKNRVGKIVKNLLPRNDPDLRIMREEDIPCGIVVSFHVQGNMNKALLTINAMADKIRVNLGDDIRSVTVAPSGTMTVLFPLPFAVRVIRDLIKVSIVSGCALFFMKLAYFFSDLADDV